MASYGEVMRGAQRLDRYTQATVQLFRVQAMTARALGDEETAENFEAAIDALLELQRAPAAAVMSEIGSPN